MGVEDNEKTKHAKKRMILHDSKAVRAALCKLARQYNNGDIPDSKIRNLIYNLNSILNADKFINLETELNQKYEQLEKLMRGESGITVDQKQIDNPYAQSLKKQLVNEQAITAELNSEILNLRRQLAGQQAEPTDSLSVDDD